MIDCRGIVFEGKFMEYINSEATYAKELIAAIAAVRDDIKDFYNPDPFKSVPVRMALRQDFHRFSDLLSNSNKEAKESIGCFIGYHKDFKSFDVQYGIFMVLCGILTRHKLI